MTVPQSQKSLRDLAGPHIAPAPRGVRASTIEPYAPVWSGQPVASSAVPQPPMHPAFERFLKRLPEEHRQSFTDEQLRALALASIPPPANHTIEYRLSLPFFGRGFYLAIFAGRERRSRSRLVAEGQLPVAQIARLDPVAWTLLLSLIGFGAVTALLLAKAMFGVELNNSVILPEALQHLTDTEVRPN